MIVPLDLIDEGTSFSTAAFAVELGTAADVPVPVEPGLDAPGLEELELPHAAIATAQKRGTTAHSRFLTESIHTPFLKIDGEHMPGTMRVGGALTVCQHTPTTSLQDMQVSVRLFAALRERAGADQLELELPEGSCVADVLERLAGVTDGVPVVIAVNHEYADETVRLAADDELALIPPVSGGAPGSERGSSATQVCVRHVRVTQDPLAIDPLLDAVRNPRAGAIVTFSGITREVTHLDYEAYVDMAEREMDRIVTEAAHRHGLCAAAAEHRAGRVALSEPSVIVAVSAPHRDAAFAGAREIIDEIKARAPIWKKEEGEWVKGAIPPPAA